MNLFNHKPRKCTDCKGNGFLSVLINHDGAQDGKLIVSNGYTICKRCRGAGVLSTVLDKYTAQELSVLVQGRTSDDIIDDIVSGKLARK